MPEHHGLTSEASVFNTYIGLYSRHHHVDVLLVLQTVKLCQSAQGGLARHLQPQRACELVPPHAPRILPDSLQGMGVWCDI